jgi:hypothetical protein
MIEKIYNNYQQILPLIAVFFYLFGVHYNKLNTIRILPQILQISVFLILPVSLVYSIGGDNEIVNIIRIIFLSMLFTIPLVLSTSLSSFFITNNIPFFTLVIYIILYPIIAHILLRDLVIFKMHPVYSLVKSI